MPNFIIKTIQGKTLHAELTVAQTNGSEGHPNVKVCAFEDDGSGEIKMHEIRLGDIYQADKE